MSVRETILNSIKYVRETIGYTLVSEEWGSSNSKCACPMGCVLLQNGLKQLELFDLRSRAAAILNVSELWVDSFIDGFDDIGNAEGASDPEAWNMGYSIATETKPIPYTIFIEDGVDNES